MKRLFTILLTFLYISSSTGATIHMHYCMGKMAGWGLFQNSSKNCSKCGMEKKDSKNDGCCKDDVRFIKNETDQQTVAAGFQFSDLTPFSLPISFVDLPPVGFRTITVENPAGHDPPLNNLPAVYLLNRCFRI